MESIEAASTGYNLELSAVAHPDGAGESFDTSRQVGVLAGSQTFSDWVGDIDSSDYYQFTLDANRTVNIQLSGVSETVSLLFFDSGGDYVYNDINGNSIDPMVVRCRPRYVSISGVLAPSVYFVKVSQ